MPKAIWNGAVLAESDRCEVVEETSTSLDGPTQHNTGPEGRIPSRLEQSSHAARVLGASGDEW